MIVYRGSGIVDTLINKLPVELHIPGYNYCGPGTKLEKRLKRGDRGINPLDEACKEHDIAYHNSRDLESRHRADAVLAEKAWQRVRAPDARFGERAAAWTVTNIMKAKRKMGAGTRRSVKRGRVAKKRLAKHQQKMKTIALRKVVNNAREAIKKAGPVTLDQASRIAVRAAKAYVGKIDRGNTNILVPRVLAVPKSGGLLPLLPALFGGLTALGSLAGGASAVTNAVKAAQNARAKLAEQKRHNREMETLAIGHGIYMAKRRSGYGLYLGKKPPKNS